MPYGEGYSCPRCAASQRPPDETSPLRWQLKQLFAALARLPASVLRWFALGVVVLVSWLGYRMLRTEIVVGGDTRFAPNLSCRSACAEANEDALRGCRDEECTARKLDQLATCEGGCDAANPRARSVLDFSYAWGKAPEWPFVWAALVSNPKLSKCFDQLPRNVALRVRVSSAGLIEKLALSSHGGVGADTLEACLRVALQGQVLPTAKSTYVYAATQFNPATVDYGEVQRALEKRLARAAEDEDALASAKVGEALSQIKTAESLRTERKALAEEAKRQAVPKAKPSPFGRVEHTHYSSSSDTPHNQTWPQYNPYQYASQPARPEPARASSANSHNSDTNREYLRRVEADVEQMRESRIEEERRNRERVQNLNMQRELMKAVKQQLTQGPSSEER